MVTVFLLGIAATTPLSQTALAIVLFVCAATIYICPNSRGDSLRS
jgi:hypothetical protein